MSAWMQAPLPDPLVVMALEQESGGAFGQLGVPVLYSGVGKINAAYCLTRKLAEYLRADVAIPLVINFGTAGSGSFPPGTTVACTSFIQRDMDVTALGFPAGTTPFDEGPPVLQFPSVLDDLPNATCGTGDSFATAATNVLCNVIDMEAFSFAKVCSLYGARFVCVKYITDAADSQAAVAWQENLRGAGSRFVAIYNRLSNPRWRR